ncbi:hypothetical protein [Synechococcus sp. MVIR-18-1]|uniref:hypothetical protein n=1 Tax=Synechococcus sp. MVIR-18-1 TaxID=1386941 RepID=UPI001647D736|nr:hypothetical protein [Synechococcus sp. MVIR-18-1]QNI76219.1 hypothetical protein SynMVIR181_01242 [Synechococcus sp. MVIR-18-1]
MEPTPPSAAELARYLESREELSKPWMLQMLRLAKLKETRGSMSQEDYMCSIRQAHSDLMRLGEFWKGREAEVFSGVYLSNDVIEPLPGSSEDR